MLLRLYLYVQQILVFFPILSTSASPTYPNMSHERRASQAVATDPTSAPSLLRHQFINPSEVLSVLLIIGGDIVQKAIAQMCGGIITPVAFSFGWVSYAFNSLMSAFGDGVLMPSPDFPAYIITVSSGGKKANESWVLSRLIRDLEKEEEKHLESWMVDGTKHSEGDSGLLITVFEAESGAATAKWDALSWSYLATLLLQLGVAAIPIGLNNNWTIMLITAAGSVLAIATGSLPEWRREKFGCRRNSKDTYALTRGNGHKHVFVVQDPWDPVSDPDHEIRTNLYLEDLAGSVQAADHLTRTISVIFTVLWIIFLITVGSASSSSDTWYLLGVGSLGMAQNVLVAGYSRNPSAHGIPMHIVRADPALNIEDGRKLGRKKKGMDKRPKVMNVLYEAEDMYPGLGLSLKDLFFPVGQLTKEEIAKWDEYASSLKTRRKDKREEYKSRKEQVSRVHANKHS